MKSTLLHSFSGFGFLWEGLKLINQSGLRRFVVIPLLINLLVFFSLFLVGLHYVSDFSTWVKSLLPHWLDWLDSLVWLFFVISGFLLAAYSFMLIATIIAAPFNALLAAKIQQRLTGTLINPDERWTDFFKEIKPAMCRERDKLTYYLPRAIGLLILFFIPVINVITPILWFIFNAWMLAVQYIDYNYENNKINFNEGRQELHEHRWKALGFGASITLLTLIPIVNFFVMPAAVAGGTLFWYSYQKK